MSIQHPGNTWKKEMSRTNTGSALVLRKRAIASKFECRVRI